MKKVALALVLVASLGLFGCAGGDHASVSKDNGMIEVSVVDKSYETEYGASFAERKSVEEYQYDDQGKLVLVERSSVNEDDESEASSRQSFEYDDVGNVTQVSSSIRHHDWNVGGIKTFLYDDSGRCVECSYEVVSQGVGKRTVTYDYSDSGQIVSGFLLSTCTDPITAVGLQACPGNTSPMARSKARLLELRLLPVSISSRGCPMLMRAFTSTAITTGRFLHSDLTREVAC